jgi:hypothetical protein
LAVLGPGAGTTLALSMLVASWVLATGGAWRVSRGLGSGAVASAALLGLLMFVPVVSMIVMIALYLRARRALRKAGYTVGLLGAKAKSRSFMQVGGNRGPSGAVFEALRVDARSRRAS